MKRLSYLLAISAMMLPSAAIAQGIGDLIRGSVKSAAMKQVCLRQDFLSYFTATTFGFYNGLQNNQTENELALEIANASTAHWSFVDWRGTSVEGSCHMNISIKLPQVYAAEFGGQSELQGAMYINIVNNDGTWKIRSISDNLGHGDNSFLNFTRPYVRALLRNRQDKFRLAKQQADARAQAEAETSREEWKRTHPQEHAAEIAAAQQRDAEYRAFTKAKQEDEARRAKACEANGGTWGRPTYSYGADGPLGCYFQTVEK